MKNFQPQNQNKNTFESDNIFEKILEEPDFGIFIQPYNSFLKMIPLYDFEQNLFNQMNQFIENNLIYENKCSQLLPAPSSNNAPECQQLQNNQTNQINCQDINKDALVSKQEKIQQNSCNNTQSMLSEYEENESSEQIESSKTNQIILQENQSQNDLENIKQNNNNNKQEHKMKKRRICKKEPVFRNISNSIEFVQSKVGEWRNLYQAGKTLKEAALIVGIPKKTLDDYFMQIKKARNLNFDFQSYKHQKIGFLRKFIKIPNIIQ